MAEETKENKRIANRNKVRKCRQMMDEVTKAVAKLENTLRKRLFRQKEKNPQIEFRCDDHLLPTEKQLEQRHQKTKEQKASDRERVRTYRSKLSTEKKEEAKKQNTKRKAELRQLKIAQESSLERIQRLEQQAYTKRKSIAKKNGTSLISSSKDYYMRKHD